MNKLFNKRNTFILLLILAGASTRIIPHPFNFTAITAIALFAGARFSNRLLAFSVPFAAMLITDAFLGFGKFNTLAIYSSFGLIVIIGMMLKNKSGILPVATASLTSSVLFYLVTNFSAWPRNPLYSKDLSGLIQSYIAGIPFFQNQVLGDLFYTAILFGGFYFAENRFPSLVREKVKS